MRRHLLISIAAVTAAALVPLGVTTTASSPVAARSGALTAPIDEVKPVWRGPGEAKSAGEAEVEASGIAGGYVFVPINPYRTFDSRNYADGYMLGGDTMWFEVLTNEFGVQQIPADAVAVTYNLAIVDTSGSGFLSVYPADIYWPGNASINWSYDGTTLSNGGTVAIGYYTGPGQIEVYCGPALVTTGTDFVIDITGYYL